MFRLFRFYTETESFDVSIEPKQTEDPPKQSIFGYFSEHLGLFRFVMKFLIFGFMKQTETNAKQILFWFVSVGTKIYFCLFQGHPSFNKKHRDFKLNFLKRKTKISELTSSFKKNRLNNGFMFLVSPCTCVLLCSVFTIMLIVKMLLKMMAFQIFFCGRAEFLSDLGFVLFSFFNVLWATLYLASWKRRSVCPQGHLQPRPLEIKVSMSSRASSTLAS